MGSNFELYNDYRISFETPDDGYSYFFGYYDKSPLNISNDKLLAHRVSFDGRDVQDGDIAEVGYFNLLTGEFIKVDETLAWNWQQGSQLQWLPPEFDEEIIYNSIDSNQFILIIFNIHTGEKRVIPFPIYVIHPNGKEALGVNYERHYWCRPGYNYQNIKNKKWDQPYHDEDGIYRIDLLTGVVNRIIGIEEIVAHEKLPEFKVNNNWLEHMMYNPSGSRFMFFHRWHENGVDHTRCYTANEYGSEVYLYPDTRFYSHAYWKTDTELAIWAHPPGKKTNRCLKLVQSIKKSRVLRPFAKKLYHLIKPAMSEGAIQKISPSSKLLNFIDRTGQYEIIGDGCLPANGHNSWNGDNSRILIDSYDDTEGFRDLMIYSLPKKSSLKIGRFFSRYNECGYRADLHPRFSHDEQFIVIDSAHEKRRKIIIIEVTDSTYE